MNFASGFGTAGGERREGKEEESQRRALERVRAALLGVPVAARLRPREQLRVHTC